MSQLRIFSYLPNPRIWKATIAARLCDVDVEIRGASPLELPGWLWDFDARRLTPEEKAAQQGSRRTATTGFAGRLYKTDAFMDANPFGRVPAAFSGDGSVGIFESNSIARAVARLGNDRFPVYGTNAYAAARIDGYLDATLVFARDAQRYLLSIGGEIAPDVHAGAKQAYDTWLAGIERGLAGRTHLVGDDVTLADICFVAELALYSNEQASASRVRASGLEPIFTDDALAAHPRAAAHYERLCAHEAFVPDVADYLAKLARAAEKDRAR